MTTEFEEQRKFWNERYTKERYIWNNFPSICLKNSLNIFKERNVKIVVDVGCGYGRDVIALLKNGFYAYGVDIAEEGIKLAKQWALEDGLYSNFIISNCLETPFPSSCSDAVIYHRSLHLMPYSIQKQV